MGRISNWNPKLISFDTTLDFDDQQDVEVEIEVRLHGEDSWDIISVCRAADGSELVLTSDLDSAVTNYVNDHLDEGIADAEADYADYRYEQWRDAQMEEHWHGD